MSPGCTNTSRIATSRHGSNSSFGQYSTLCVGADGYLLPYSFTILHSFWSLQHALCGRGLLSATQLVITLHTMDGRMKLLIAKLYFTIANIVDLRLQLFQKDRDEQVRLTFKFWSLQYALCGRRLLSTIQFITILHTTDGRRRLLTAMQFFTILHRFWSLQHALCGRGLLSSMHLVTILHNGWTQEVASSHTVVHHRGHCYSKAVVDAGG